MRKLIIYLLIALMALAMFSCKGSERIVEVPVTKIEYKDRVKEKVDSVYIHDSTYMYVGGDTIYVYQYRNVYRDKIYRDTVSVVRVDSIAVPYPIERELTFWEKAQMNISKIFFIVFGFVALFWLAKIVWYRIRSRT